MSKATKIEWCDSTFNPWVGCTKISPACDHCYAEAQMDTRMGRVEWGSGKPRSRTSAAYWKQPVYWNRRPFAECIKCGWRGEQPHILNNNGLQIGFSNICPACRDHKRGVGDLKPARRRVFCASLADVFDNESPAEWLADLLYLIWQTPNLDWLLLTKRIGNWQSRIRVALSAEIRANGRSGGMLGDWMNGSPPANVWLGATVVNQQEADRDIPKLLAVPAAKRFLSLEPMLGPVDVGSFMWPTHWHWDSRFKSPAEARAAGAYAERKRQGIVLAGSTFLDWIICGGESGPHARPMHPDWVRSLRDQCAAAGVPFLFKQWGEWVPRGPESMGYPLVDSVPRIRLTNRGENGHDLGAKGGDHCWMQRAGKKAAGRQLDGREHSEWPE